MKTIFLIVKSKMEIGNLDCAIYNIVVHYRLCNS